MKSTLIIAALTLAAPCIAVAQQLGNHPAVVVQRLQSTAGYDYASKFYPHPAWLYLAAQAPRPLSDHPAVIVARRAQQERQAQVAAAALAAAATAPARH